MWALFRKLKDEDELVELVDTYLTEEDAEMALMIHECHYDADFFIKELDKERG